MSEEGGKRNSYTVAKRLLSDLQHRMENPTDLDGYSTGMPTLDWFTGGFSKGLWIFGGETGSGKTRTGMQFVYAVAKQLPKRTSPNATPEKVVRVVLGESDADQFQMSLAAQIAEYEVNGQRVVGLDERLIRRGRLNPAERKAYHQAVSDVALAPIEYLDEPTSLNDVVDFIKQDDNCVLYLVDHAQCMPTKRPGLAPHSVDAIAELANTLALVSKKDTPGILLSQYVNDVGKREDHRPSKADLYGAKTLIQPASIIICAYRPDVYQQVPPDRRDDPKHAYFIVDKNRLSKEVGDFKVIWNPSLGMYTDMGFKALQVVEKEAA